MELANVCNRWIILNRTWNETWHLEYKNVRGSQNTRDLETDNPGRANSANKMTFENISIEILSVRTFGAWLKYFLEFFGRDVRD